MTARIIKADFAHVANATSGWYVEVRGTREEVMGDVGAALAEESALAHGWAPDDRASAGWPTQHNLREYERSFWFYGQGVWPWHRECWCRHQFCPHTNRQGDRCTADAPYRREAVPA